MNLRKSSTRESFGSVHRFLWSASLAAPPERLHKDIRRFLDTFHSLVEQDVDGVASQAASSRLAVVVFFMLKSTESQELRDMLAPELARFGPFGLALAAHYIVASPLETKELDKLFSDLPPHLLLALMDEVVVRAGGRGEIRDWAISFLDMLAGQNEQAATQHLAVIQNDLEGPSYALERAILDGPFGKRLHQVMQTPKSMWEVVEYAQNAAILPSAPLAEPLAGLLDSCSPELLPPLIEVLTKQGEATPALTKAIVNRLSHKDEKVRVAALDGLLALHPPNIGPLLAKVHARLLGLRDVLITRLPLLPRADFNAFLKQIPDEQRPDLLYRLYCLLSRLDPESLKSTLRQTLVELGRKRPAQSTVQSLEAWFPEPELPLPDRPEPPTPTESMTLAGNAPKDSGGLLGGLFGKPGKKSAGKASQQEQVLRVVKNKLQRAEFKAHRLPGALLEDAELDGCVMERAYFEKAVFTRCAIRHVNFQQAAFLDCSFTECTFESCDLSGSKWHGCSFSDVVFSCCVMDHAQLHQNQWRQVMLDSCTLLEAVLTAQDIMAARLFNVDFTEASLNRVEANGLELAGCLLDRTLFYRCLLDNVTTWALRIRSSGASGLESFHPDLVAIEKHSLRDRIDAVAGEAWRGEDEGGVQQRASAPAVRLAGEVVLRWFAARALKAKLMSYLACNIRREEWCKQKLGRGKWKMYKVLPLLLSTEAFDKASGLYPSAPPCRVAGYAPDYTTVRIAQELFPDEGEWLKPAEDAVTIDAVFTIGSMGTVAQNEASDLDYWVCANLAGIAETDREGLNQKLEMLTTWAEEQFGLEAYFFLMDNEDVRNNNFGFSDKESSGSAQALMLKEEFYRTAVLSAGKYPAWWFAPPGAGPKVYRRVTEQVRRLLGEDRVIDLGHVGAIPPEEFFGAALWQIVKGLKSPFKSIMKFGLLERYTMGSEEGGVLLCDRIKRSLHEGASSLWEIDPYVVMFREILEHYERSSDRESARLAALSFHPKARLAEAAAQASRRPATRREKDMLELFSKTTGVGRDSSTAALAASDLTFEQLAALSGRVNQFMTKTYTRVRQSQSDGSKLAITPEDLTKLGRKIFATFSRRRFKVERAPFLNLKSDFFSQMHIGVQHDRKGRIWEISAGKMDEAHGRVRISQLKKGPDLMQLFAWITANKLFHPDMQLKMDMQTAPLTPQDVKELLTSMASFFPSKLTFETDIDETLKAERITRAFFVLNLMAPREADAIKEVSLVYSTNWGELFCQDMPPDDEVITVDPHQYLKNHLDIEAPETPAMELYIPNRSMCPGILLI